MRYLRMLVIDGSFWVLSLLLIQPSSNHLVGNIPLPNRILEDYNPRATGVQHLCPGPGMPCSRFCIVAITVVVVADPNLITRFE